MHALEPWLVDASFRGPFGRDSLLLMPGLLAWGLMQFALSAPFQIAGRTWPIVLPGLVGLAANALLAVALPQRLGGEGQALAYSGGMALALVVAVLLATRRGGIALPWRDIGAIVVATAAMALYAGLLARQGPWWLALPLAVAGGGSLYALSLILFDVGGLGSALRQRRDAIVA
jgi:O-antigen/teichoic acid export membrane protein